MTRRPPVIGLSGVARAGKDTVGKILHDLYGYKVYSFSETLNDCLIALNPWVFQSTGENNRFHSQPVRYATLIEEIGYEAAKEEPEVRRLLQAMGSEVGRDILGSDIWVEALFKKIQEGRRPLVAISNVRFPNEYEAVKRHGGVVWRVDRPGYEPALGHRSDTALRAYQFDQNFYNDGTVEDLAQKVISAVERV